jgi:hypothetical protein
MSKKVKTDNHLNEPQTVYNKTAFGSYHSFEEANEADAAFMATLSGEQHLSNVTELIAAMYKQELKEPFDKTIRTK